MCRYETQGEDIVNFLWVIPDHSKAIELPYLVDGDISGRDFDSDVLSMGCLLDVGEEVDR